MKRAGWISSIILTGALLVACGAGKSAEPAAPSASPVNGTDDAGALSSTYSPLTIHVAEKSRQVAPDSDEEFELLVANESQQDLPVVFVLEHADGQRWRTSLCVAEQCILGNGKDKSVTDPVVLPSLLEQPFQAHVFVDGDARAGQSTTLVLRVEPQVTNLAPQEVQITAEVVGP